MGGGDNFFCFKNRFYERITDGLGWGCMERESRVERIIDLLVVLVNLLHFQDS